MLATIWRRSSGELVPAWAAGEERVAGDERAVGVEAERSERMARRVQHADAGPADLQRIVVGEQELRLPPQPVGILLVHSDGQVCQALQVRVSGDVVRVRVGDDDSLHLKVDRLVQQTLDLGRGVDEVRPPWSMGRR